MGHTAARFATQVAFWVAGFGIACWAPLVPYAKERLQVDDATLGLLLLCLGIGAVAAMVRTGPLCSRHGCKPIVILGGVTMVLLLPTLAAASTPIGLGLALLAFGAGLGTVDVAMNIHAIEVERSAGKPLMSGFHGLFSVGGFCGAGLMTLLLSLSMSPQASTVLCSALMAVAMWIAAPRLIATTQAPTSNWVAVPRGPVVLLAALAAVTFLVEGALLDWSALLLSSTGLTTSAQAGLGYAVFSVAMVAGRFAGDAVVARYGDLAVLFWGGVITLLGFAVLLLSTRLALAVPGFVLIGIGASNAVPILFRSAGSQGAMPAALAVSAITTVGYAGYLIGPAVVGFVSHAAGLPAAFWGLAALMALVPAFARHAAAK